VELARVPDHDGDGPGAGGREHRRDQAVRGGLRLHSRSRAVDAGGGLPVRRRERRYGWPRCGRSTGRSPKIAFTGGIEAGRAIAAKAGNRLIPCTLELGGKSPNIVFADANLDAAEAGILAGIFAACGQTCVAGSRTFIERPVFDEILSRLAKRASNIVIGDPMQAETQMGPVANQTQLEKNIGMVARAKEQGAKIVYGGDRPTIPNLPNGLFFKPTILTGVTPDSDLARREVFGPVLGVTPFDSEEQVIALANDSDFGLAAGIWTLNFQRAHKVAKAVRAGTVWINMYRAMAPQSPFGGYKQSGLGRQNGVETIDQYLQTKSVWCETSSDVQDPFVLRT
jgi:aldehyde dehydrogenase (NAD+)